MPLPGSTKVYEKPPIYVLDQADWETRQKHQDCLFCDPASILIPRLFTNHPKTIADFCAAPGNKLRSLHQHYRPESLLGLEKDKHRFEEMQQRLLPLAMNGLVLQNADALEQNGLFDAILLDAPCSAFGTILSQPEFLISKSVEDKSSRVPLQKSLLEKAWACLKPGGELLYSVCTFTKEETEDLFEVLPADAESIPVGVPWRGNWVGGRIGSWLFPEGLGDQMFYLAHLKKICT